MAGIIEKAVLKKTYKEIETQRISWRLSDFSKTAETCDSAVDYDSPVFFINDVAWFFTLYPRTGKNNEFMSLYIQTKSSNREYSLEFEFSLMKSDGSEQQLYSGIVEKKYCNIESGYQVIKRSEILEKKSELLLQDVLTIICTVKYETVQSMQPTASDKTVLDKLIRLDKLSENFKDLFGDKETCDATLNVKDKAYRAHKSVLIARSSVFAATFKHDTLERKTGIVNILDCDADSFALFLEYLYCGKLEEISDNIALNLYYTSDKYDIQELKAFCVEYLIKHLTVENVCEVVVFADRYDETALLSAVQNYFNENASNIFVTSEWEHLMKKDSRLAKKLLVEMSKVKLKG